MSYYVKFVINNWKYRKIRTLLTIIGIIIGIASIIALISISNGLQNAIEEQFEKIGSDRIFIGAKGDFMGGSEVITIKDLEALENIPELESVNPFLMVNNKEIKYKNQIKYTSLIGWPTDKAKLKFEDYDLGFREGSDFKEGDKYSIIFGHKAAKDLFDNEINARNNIEMGGTKFQVRGILNEIGNNQDDYQIYVPLETLRELFNKKKEITYIDAKIKDGFDIKLVAEKVRKKLKKARGDENFEVFTPEEILKFLKNILIIVQVTLVSIAAISLVVGGLGIMNSMYTNVLERTKEIGIMKSVGANKKDVFCLFVIESGLIGAVGGAFGCLFGFLSSKFVEYLAKNSGFKLMQIKFDFELMLFGLLFAFVIGIISGALPAKQASNLIIAEALRHD